jgi:hypothetical protein
MADLNMSEIYTDEPEQSFEPVPNGDYIAVISDSEKTVKDDGARERLNLVWEIIDGNFKEKKIFEGLNIVNPSDKAQIISRRSLSEITRIAGINPHDLVDSAQLHNIPMKIRVVAIDKNDGYGMKNEVKRHFPATGEAPKQAQAGATTQSPPAAASKGAKKHPWEK